MEIKIGSLIDVESIKDYKIHFAVWNGHEDPLDVFVRDREEWKGWNGWKGGRDDFSRRYIFSLIRYRHRPGTWLFGGIFEVIERLPNKNIVALTDKYNSYIGRLLIEYHGPGSRGRAFYLEKHFDGLVLSQIFEKPYTGEAFCGYENIEHSFPVLESIFVQKKPDWKSALENVKGVYLIADKSNGKKYVGSAYGDSGIWSRWSCYIGTGHGWNDELTKIIKMEGKDYARRNFQFSLLEYRSMKTDDKVIIEREQYWKRALLSGAFGYNLN